MIKTKDFHYKIDKVIEITGIEYKYIAVMLKKLKVVVNIISDYLDLIRERIIFNNPNMLNIESDAEVDIDKFKQKSLIKFYGFYND